MSYMSRLAGVHLSSSDQLPFRRRSHRATSINLLRVSTLKDCGVVFSLGPTARTHKTHNSETVSDVRKPVNSVALWASTPWSSLWCCPSPASLCIPVHLMPERHTHRLWVPTSGRDVHPISRYSCQESARRSCGVPVQRRRCGGESHDLF